VKSHSLNFDDSNSVKYFHADLEFVLKYVELFFNQLADYYLMIFLTSNVSVLNADKLLTHIVEKEDLDTHFLACVVRLKDIINSK